MKTDPTRGPPRYDAAIAMATAPNPRKLAADPSTPAEVLTKLARSTSPVIRELVARNPNTSVEALSWLVQDFPEAVRENPQLIFLELTGGGDAESEKAAARIFNRLAEANLRVESIADQAESHVVAVRIGAARNPRTPPALLSRLSRDPDAQVRKGAAQNDRTPTEDLVRLANDPQQPEDVLDWVASNQNLPASEVEKLLRHPSQSVRHNAMANPNLASDRLVTIFQASRNDPVARMIIAKNPSVNPDVLMIWAMHQDPLVRASVARNPSVWEVTLENLAQDKARGVRDDAKQALKQRKATGTG